MSIVASCVCGKQFRVNDEYAGKKAKCPGCGERFVIPAPSAKSTGPAAVKTPKPLAKTVPKPVAKPPKPVAPPPVASDWDSLEELESTGTVQDEAPISVPAPAAFTAKAEPQTRQRACPSCGRTISSFAIICEYCHASVGKTAGATTGKKSASPALAYRSAGSAGVGADDALSGLDWVMIILCPGIGLIVGIIRMIQGNPNGKKLAGFSVGIAILVSLIKVAIFAALQH